jgi:hypothetical protein
MTKYVYEYLGAVTCIQYNLLSNKYFMNSGSSVTSRSDLLSILKTDTGLISITVFLIGVFLDLFNDTSSTALQHPHSVKFAIIMGS